MKVETIDPFADKRGDPYTLFNVLPRTRATLSVPPNVGVYMGWQLFWRSVWASFRGRKTVKFWVEDGS